MIDPATTTKMTVQFNLFGGTVFRLGTEVGFQNDSIASKWHFTTRNKIAEIMSVSRVKRPISGLNFRPEVEKLMLH